MSGASAPTGTKDRELESGIMGAEGGSGAGTTEDDGAED